VRAGRTSVAFTLDRHGNLSRAMMASCVTAWTPCTPRACGLFPATRWWSCRAARRGPSRPTANQATGKARRSTGPGLG
jgi:hypothetical protein